MAHPAGAEPRAMNTSSASARGLRLPPLRSAPRPGSCSSPAGSRARAQSHTATPRRRNNRNNRGSRSPAAGRTPRPPAGRSVTVSPPPQVLECRGWCLKGVLEAAGSRIYSQAGGTNPRAPPAPPSRVRVPEDFPDGNSPRVSPSLQPPGAAPPASPIPARLWFGEGAPALQHLEQPPLG